MAEYRNSKSFLIGWREWCALPELRLPAIKAKIDTGARTSAIHAFDIKPIKYRNKNWVRFNLHPLQGNDKVIVKCSAEIIDEREVMSSNGHKEHRYVILTPLLLGPCQWNIELTLSNRDPLRFRLLLGREAMQKNILINPVHSYYLKKYSQLQQKKLYLGDR